MKVIKNLIESIKVGFLLLIWYFMLLMVKPIAWLFYNTVRLINDFLFLINGKKIEIILGDDEDESTK